MKAYTDIEQSKKLAEILPLESADMYYMETSYNNYTIGVLQRMETDMLLNHAEYYKMFPAWSLAALLKLIKSEIYGETIYGDTITYKVDFRKYKLTDDVDLYQIAYGSIKFDVDGQYSFKDMVNTGQKEDPIDAAFQMVVWLKENGKL